MAREILGHDEADRGFDDDRRRLGHNRLGFNGLGFNRLGIVGGAGGASAENISASADSPSHEIV